MAYQFIHRSITESLYLALKNEPFYNELVRSVSEDPVQKQEALMMYFDYSMIESQKYGALYIPEGKTYGASIWSKPTDDVLSNQIFREKSDFIRQYLGEISLKKYIEIVSFMSERARAIVPAESWYLSILGVTPTMQGKGLGSALVKPVLEITDAIGAPSYLETFTHGNLYFYQRLGYKEAASLIEPATASEYWIMLREPFSGKS